MGSRSTIEVAGGALEYELERGDPDRPPLVFLHEALGSIDQWRGYPAAVRSGAGDPTTVVYARHGHGRAGAPIRMPRPVSYLHHEAHVVLPSLLDALGLARPILIGHSDGASISLLHAGAGHPVCGIVAIAPHVFVEDVTIAGIEAARASFATGDLGSGLARHHRDPETLFRAWSEVWTSPAFRGWNIEDHLPSIVAPTLLVQGSEDRYGTLAQLDAIEAGLGGLAHRLVVDGAGHAPHLEAPEPVVEATVAFVRALR